MKLVATMLVGNEADLIAPAIETALAQGVDAFVIVETASRDATADVLRRYCDDARFDITFLPHDTVYGPTPPHPYTIWQGMIERAKARFAADWVLRIDADEFLMVPGGDLKAVCAGALHHEVHLRRLNALVPCDGSDLSEVVGDPRRLAALPVMARPFPNALVRSGDVADIPLILTHVAQRPMTRAEPIVGYDPGGHLGLDADGRSFDHAVTDKAWIIHLWFTTEERFLGKAQFLHDITASVRSRTPGGWQWSRWASQAATDTSEISAEFRRQVLDETTLATLQAQGRVTRADAVDPLAFLQDTDRAADDLRSLGYGQPRIATVHKGPPVTVPRR
ncbi:MAG: glycosyltransferase family 2 protein [Pseudomonadota bacterium]